MLWKKILQTVKDKASFSKLYEVGLISYLKKILACEFTGISCQAYYQSLKEEKTDLLLRYYDFMRPRFENNFLFLFHIFKKKCCIFLMYANWKKYVSTQNIGQRITNINNKLVKWFAYWVNCLKILWKSWIFCLWLYTEQKKMGVWKLSWLLKCNTNNEEPAGQKVWAKWPFCWWVKWFWTAFSCAIKDFLTYMQFK